MIYGTVDGGTGLEAAKISDEKAQSSSHMVVKAQRSFGISSGQMVGLPKHMGLGLDLNPAWLVLPIEASADAAANCLGLIWGQKTVTRSPNSKASSP